MKYAIKVMLSKDDWIYVTVNKGYCDWDLQPKLFDTLEEAEAFADSWRQKGKEQYIRVVEYDVSYNNS